MPNGYQINSHQLFLTYPHCTLTKDEALTLLNLKFTIEDYVVAHELHESGDSHIHCYLKLDKSSVCRFRDSHFADIGGYHGNYQGCRSPKNVIKYCTKAEDYISNLNINDIIAKKSQRKRYMEDIVGRKRTLLEVIEDDASMLVGYTKLKADIDNFFQDQAFKTKEALPDFLPNPFGIILPAKIRDKKRHYWIYSDKPNLGKTFKFARPLRERFAATIVTEFAYWPVTKGMDILILDDYNHAHLKWNALNQLADNTYGFRVFQQGILYCDNYLVIVLSNTSIESLYPYKNEFILARFNQIKLD